MVNLVIIIGAFALLIDGGLYLVMRNRAWMIVGAPALSGAGILDIGEAAFSLPLPRIYIRLNALARERLLLRDRLAPVNDNK